MKTSTHQNSGFTLIETLIYLALFIIIIGGGMIATYQIIQASEASINHTILQEEANFLLRKIDGALTGATSVNPSGTTLTVTNGSTLTFSFSNPDIRLDEGSGPITLNSSGIKVSNLSFTDIPAAGGSPRGITTSFTLTTAQNGRNVSQAFTTTKYLRQ